jgi:8-oxo-dGTP pyrophosphatase MutT (NUDIX family)
VSEVRYAAAGGVVVAGERVLVLLRPGRGEVRLPKGKIEPGEDARTTALREVSEETGFADLEIVEDLGEQTTEYDQVDDDGTPLHVVREERYFLMRLTSKVRREQPPEDAEEFTTDLRTADEAIRMLTYDGEKEWVRRALEVVRTTAG